MENLHGPKILFRNLLTRRAFAIGALSLTLVTGCGKPSKSSTVRFSQENEGAARFQDAFVVNDADCAGASRWGYVPRDAVEVESLERFISRQNRELLLRSITVEVARGKRGQDYVDANGKIRGRQHYRIVQGSLALPEKTPTFGEALPSIPSQNFLAERSAYVFLERCASDKLFTVQNQSFKDQLFPTILKARGQYNHLSSLSHNPNVQRELPSSIGVMVSNEHTVIEKKNLLEFGLNEFVGSAGFWQKRKVYVTPKGFLLQYSRRQTDLIAKTKKDDGVVEGDDDAKNEKENQLTLTLLYEVDPTLPSAADSPWTEEKMPEINGK